jgi:hypothetical protein
MSDKVKILVCCNKNEKLPLPQEDIFFPIQSGKAVSDFGLKMQGDDTGDDNISCRNEMFGEYTAWYWAWKNIKKIYPNLEYIGLAHYRRFFNLDADYYERVLIPQHHIPKMEKYEELILKKLENNDIILVKPLTFSCSLKEQYSKFHYESDLLCMKNIIHEIYPEYDETFVNYIEKNSIALFHCMFISRYEFFTKYSE